MPKELMVQLIAFVIVLVLVLISQAIKIVQEWERGVVFRLGRFVRAAGPGIQFIIPLIERMIKVDIRVFTVDVPKQEIITKDNVTVRANAVVYFRSLTRWQHSSVWRTTFTPPNKSPKRLCGMWWDKANLTNFWLTVRS